MATYYEILEVPIQATFHEIKVAFREKAKTLHPDVNKDVSALQDFQIINEAYQTLINPKKRRIYDLRLKHGITKVKVYYRPSGAPQRKYRPKGYPYRSSKTMRQEERQTELDKYFDIILFISLLSIGCFAFFYGLYRLYINPIEDRDPTPGILLGAVFTSLLIILWIKKGKIFQ